MSEVNDPEDVNPSHAFQVLGPLTIVHGRDSLVLPPSKPTVVLAALLLNANHVVTADSLRQVVWDDGQPAGAKAALQTCVLRLRQLFTRHGIANTVIETVAGGYRMVAEARTLDLVRFRELVRQAAGATTAEEQLQLLDTALALWREPLLGNVPSESLRHKSLPQLVEERLRVIEQLGDLRLARGQAGAAIPVLRSAVRDHPGHEGISERLVRALYRTGRQVDALTEIRRIREYLRDELGVDLGRSLTTLEIAILRGEELDPPTSVVVQSPEPADTEPFPSVPQFTGRARDSAAILALLDCDDQAGRGPVVVTGPPGIGKTALALHVALLIVDRGDRVPCLLRGTGPDGRIRTSEEIEADFRAWSGRRTDRTKRALIVLDDVRQTGQVPAELLEWSQDRAVIITSRTSLASLAARHGTQVHRVGALEPDESVGLLRTLLGTERAEAEPGALHELAAACGHFPLSLRIAGARLLTRPGMRVEDVVTWLAKDRIDRLALPDDPQMSVVNRLRSWLDRLTPSLVDAFVRIGNAAPPVFSAESAAAVLATSTTAAEGLLDRLVDANLIEEGSGQYTMHELLRIFARTTARSAS